MRVTKEHYNKLEIALRAELDSFTTEELQFRVRAYQKDKDFNDWRIAFMWAVYFKVKPLTRVELEGYLDAHIETALKKAIGSYIYP